MKGCDGGGCSFLLVAMRALALFGYTATVFYSCPVHSTFFVSIRFRRATEAEHRQRVFEKQRELEAKQKKQQRGEAKRRREQVRRKKQRSSGRAARTHKRKKRWSVGTC